MEDEERGEAETAPMQAEDAEMMERLQEEIRNLPVAEHLIYMMHSLSALAVGRMGLAPDAGSGKDLDQARLAIDAFRALLEIVEKAKPGQVAALRGMLSQLQLTYVDALGAGRAGEGEPEGGDRP